MYEEFKSIESDLETLLIRLHNLQLQIQKYDGIYIVNTKELNVRITKEEAMRLLSISEYEMDLLVSFDFFSRRKDRKKDGTYFLLKEIIWLRGQRIETYDADCIASLIIKKKADSRR